MYGHGVFTSGAGCMDRNRPPPESQNLFGRDSKFSIKAKYIPRWVQER